MRHASRSALPAVIAVAVLAFPAPRAMGAPFPPPPVPAVPCAGPDCPSTWPPLDSGATGRDAGINVFVGGDYDVTGRAAEVAGPVVALGNLTVDRNGGGAFSVSPAGAGSRLPPPGGGDLVSVGGDVVSRPTDDILIGPGPDSPATGIAGGDLRYGGTTSGTVVVEPTGQAVHDTGVREQYAPLRTTIESVSDCAARQQTTGVVTVTDSEVTFTGDGTSARQVFDVGRNLASPTGDRIGLAFTGIPVGATVIVNLLSDDALINTYSRTGDQSAPLTRLRSKLLWNFPTASVATIGGARFQGSVLAGNPNGTTTLSAAGVTGWLHLAGSLDQTSGDGGYEWSTQPFEGDLPECDANSALAPAAAATFPPPRIRTASAMPTPTPPPSPPPTDTPPAGAADTAAVAQEPPERGGAAPTTSAQGGGLPDTGAGGAGPLLGTAGTLLIGGALALLLGQRLTRRRARHR
ncbi:choice-of-anchor A family protein [Kitasatospora sp. RB6PN24]|uniref:choice-of-anchor A family protein n=1 Tax=Kitasatospora humi TaxID=2893891 RepID=UPI001E3A9081|nr:choice-of-anchor A family protein [Kitasatospora humi]MCC9311029.1 choice-of-anchor A family protein [Kitasatospora humi]